MDENLDNDLAASDMALDLNMYNMESRKSKQSDVNSALQVQEHKNKLFSANKIDGSLLMNINATSETALDVAEPNSFVSTTLQNNQGAECPICEKKFKFFSVLQKHLPTHTASKPYVCHICGKAYKHQCSLSSHKSAHQNDDFFSCDICKKTFSRLSTLNNHRLEHESLACSICGKVFAKTWCLRQHEKIHAEIKPFKCDICTAAFHQSGNLKTHKLNIHKFLTKKQFFYTCQLCKKEFKKPLHLKKHKLAEHPKENLYACDACMKTFSSRYKLNKHLIKDHSNDLRNQNQHKDIQYFSDDLEGNLSNNLVDNQPRRKDPNHCLSKTPALKDFMLNKNRQDFCNAESVSDITKDSALQHIRFEDIASKYKIIKNLSSKSCVPTHATSLNPKSQNVTSQYVNPVTDELIDCMLPNSINLEDDLQESILLNDIGVENFVSENILSVDGLQKNFDFTNSDFEKFLSECNVFENPTSLKIDIEHVLGDSILDSTKLKSSIVPNEGTLANSKEKIYELKASEKDVFELCEKEESEDIIQKNLVPANVLSEDVLESNGFQIGAEEITPENVLHRNDTLSGNTFPKDDNVENRIVPIEMSKPELCKKNAYEDIIQKSLILANVFSEDDIIEIDTLKGEVKEITPKNVLHRDVTLSSNLFLKDCNVENHTVPKEVLDQELCEKEEYEDIILKSLMLGNILSEDDDMEINGFRIGAEEITPETVLHRDVTLSGNTFSKDCNVENHTVLKEISKPELIKKKAYEDIIQKSLILADVFSEDDIMEIDTFKGEVKEFTPENVLNKNVTLSSNSFSKDCNIESHTVSKEVALEGLSLFDNSKYNTLNSLQNYPMSKCFVIEDIAPDLNQEDLEYFNF